MEIPADTVDGLDSFLSESFKDTLPSESFKDTLIPRSVSLAELQSSGVPIEWYEAIAIVQDLCRSWNPGMRLDRQRSGPATYLSITLEM